MNNNLGCGYGPYSAISWAFQYTDRLIILEDDCIPSTAFFPYCEYLLEKYTDDVRIRHISGFSPISGVRVFEKYDYIFIDCPPVEIVADAAIISNQADMTLFVVRAGLLERSMLPELDRLYADGKYRNLSVILNATEAVHRRYGYHKYGYSYGYNYSYYGN